MTNSDDKKKTQKDPASKGKSKDDDKQLTSRAGSQSGQHNSSTRGDDETGSGLARKPAAKPRRLTVLPANVIGKIRQTEMSSVKQNTGAPTNNAMGLTRVGPADAIGSALPDPSAAAFSKVTELAGQLSGPRQVLQGAVCAANHSRFVQEGSKRRFVGIPSTPESRLFDEVRKKILGKKNSGHRQIDAEAEDDGQDQGYRPQKRQRRPFCVRCKSDQHYLDRCLKASDNGLMKGCPVCNTLDHSAEDCNNPRVLNDVDRMNEFVYRRRNMPSFLTFESWYELVRDNANPSPTDMDRFPWTHEFTKSIAASTDDLQKKVNDLGLEDAKLPVDPSVNGWRAVKDHFNHKAPAQVARQSGVALVSEQAPANALKSSLSVIAKTQQKRSSLRPWDSESAEEEDEDGSDDDLDDQAFRRKMLKLQRIQQEEMGPRARRHAP